MRLEIPLTELRSFLSNCYNVNLELTNIEDDKIQIDYFLSLVLTIKEVKEHEILFHYKINGFLNLLAKGAHSFLDKKLEGIPIEWDAEKNEVLIDLKKVEALKDFLKFLNISELKFVNESILLVLSSNEID